MPREIFGDVFDSSVKLGTRRWYTIPLSIVTHAIALAALVVVPLLATDMLPTPQSIVTFLVVPPPPEPVPPPSSIVPPDAPPDVDINPIAAPIAAGNAIIAEPPPRITMATGGLSPTTLGASTPLASAPPLAAPQAPIRVGGLIQAPRKLRHVDPIYPSIAKAARASGIVIIDATIAKDGSVRDAKVTRSSPLLDAAALDAVRQWSYTPPTLNGAPVDVIMTVVVNFTLK
jgi:protein TonB